MLRRDHHNICRTWNSFQNYQNHFVWNIPCAMDRMDSFHCGLLSLWSLWSRDVILHWRSWSSLACRCQGILCDDVNLWQPRWGYYYCCPVIRSTKSIWKSDIHLQLLNLPMYWSDLTSTHWGWVTHISVSINLPFLVQIMACHLVGAKPLCEPMLVYYQLEPP